VIAMQHSFTNDSIYKNTFILLRVNGCLMIDLSHFSIFGILEQCTHKDVWML
jgi:hypothetical protein